MHMRKREVSSLLLIAALLCGVVARPTRAQGNSQAENLGEAVEPELHLASGKSTYQIGELIPLELYYSSRIPGRYKLNLARYDRSGRMAYEKFIVEPPDETKDPLSDYFKSGTFFLSGGLTNFEFLSEKPIVIHLDLNEWVRIDKAGKYEVTVISRRAGDTSVGTYAYGTPKEIKSNSIQLEIVEADPAWQQAQLQNALAELSKPPTAWMTPMSEARYLAVRQLRYLGSAEAARELARHLRGEENPADWNYMFGLIGSPNRKAGLEEMRKLLADPDFPVTGVFLEAMSILPLSSTEPPESLRNQREANLKAVRAELLDLAPTKRNNALPASLDTVLRNLEPSAASEVKSKLVAELVENFNRLPIHQQVEWLDQNWSKVKDSAWLPTLRNIAAQYTDFPPPHNRMDTYESLKLTGNALMRWYELDPSSARIAVLSEITRAKPRYSANTLGLLPDKTLPEEQAAIAAHFLSATDYETEGNAASLLTRYATITVLPMVLSKIKTKVESGRWECWPQKHAVAYVEKVDAEAAKPLAEKLSQSPCQKFPLRTDLP